MDSQLIGIGKFPAGAVTISSDTVEFWWCRFLVKLKMTMLEFAFFPFD